MKYYMKSLLLRFIYFSAFIVLSLGVWALHDRNHKLTPSELVKRAEKRVVVLNGPSNENSGGTGFSVVAPSGKVYTLTNRHVCGLAENGIMSAQSEYHKHHTLLRILEISEEHDLCLLEGLPNVEGYVLNTAEAAIYEKIYVIGHPHLEPNTYREGLLRIREDIELQANNIKREEDCVGKYRLRTMRQFIFTFNICVESMDSFSTSISLYPGNSGSPVFNDQNYLVGVVFATSTSDYNGFYVPLGYVKRLLERY